MTRTRLGEAAARMLVAAAIVIVACAIATPARAQDGPNLLDNGDFSRGSGNSVNGWRTDAWILSPGTTDYLWIRPHDGQPGEVELFSHRENDARWVQTLSLAPGWYDISAEVRTVNVLPFMIGANISALEDTIHSGDLKHTMDWRRLGFYLKVGPHGADVDVALRLGGYMNLSYGQVFFRDARVVRIAAPPPGAAWVYDLDRIRKHETTGPIGQPWTLVLTFFVFVMLALAGWRMYGEGVTIDAKPARRRSRRGGRP